MPNGSVFIENAVGVNGPGNRDKGLGSHHNLTGVTLERMGPTENISRKNSHRPLRARTPHAVQ